MGRVEKNIQNFFLDQVSGEGGGLLCPHCNEPNLHHSDVDVFVRSSEDSHVGIGASVSDTGRLSVDLDQTNNPSPRRNGLLIHFWCEHCDAKPILQLYQHKGSTYLDFIA